MQPAHPVSSRAPHACYLGKRQGITGSDIWHNKHKIYSTSKAYIWPIYEHKVQKKVDDMHCK